MKKLKEPGGNISLKTKKNEDPAIMQWLNAQSNLMDSIRYLIENEVRQYGVRNLQTFVPAERPFSLSDSAAVEAGTSVGQAAVVHNQELAAAMETVVVADVQAADVHQAQEEPTAEPSATPQAAAAAEEPIAAADVAAYAEEQDEVEQIEDDIDDDDIESWT
ncbi:hypothetical protein [Paenibacillus sp. GCM10027626]|uniref:hypothetical protein n=1 Tax=Paenibacillus sp. GCM10027626 TaxID=3273411 RepID=UPI00362FAB69